MVHAYAWPERWQSISCLLIQSQMLSVWGRLIPSSPAAQRNLCFCTARFSTSVSGELLVVVVRGGIVILVVTIVS